MNQVMEELKRRRVFQVVAAYAAIAFVVAQVADIVVPALGLPEPTMGRIVWVLAAGFPVALVLAWFLDLTRRGLVRTDAAGPGQGRLLVSWRSGLLAAVAVTAVSAAVVVAGSAFWPREGAADAPGLDEELVAVLPFRVSADPSLGFLREGMMDLVAAAMAGEEGLRTADPRALLAALRDPSGPQGAAAAVDGDPVPEAAAGAARRLGAGRLLVGGVVGRAEALVITAELREVATGRVLSRARVEGPVDSVGVLADRLGRQTLALGAGEEGERMSLVSDVSTPALRQYLEGRSAYRRGAYEEAAERFAGALALEPDFVLAALGVLRTVGWVDIAGEVVSRSARLASRERGRLGWVDQLQLDEILGPRYPEASSGREVVEAARHLAEAAPDRAEGWYRYAERLLHIGPALGMVDAHELALRAFDRALELDPGSSVPALHRMELALTRGDTGTVLHLAHAYGDHATDGFAAQQMRWLAAVASGDPRALASVRAELGAGRWEDPAYLSYVAQLGPFDLETAELAVDALARHARTPDERVQAALTRRVLAANLGDTARARVALDEALAVASEEAAAELWILQVQDALYWGGSRERARDGARRLAEVEAQPDDGPVGADLLVRARCWGEQWRLSEGELGRAQGTIRRLEALSGAPRYVGSMAALCARLLEAQLEARAGAVPGGERAGGLDALARLDAAARTAPPVPSSLLHGVNLTAARLYAERGEPERALAAVRRRYHLYSGSEPVFLRTMLEEEARLAHPVGVVLSGRPERPGAPPAAPNPVHGA